MMVTLTVMAAACGASIAQQADSPWVADFAAQPIASRPRLEARYTDAGRQAAEILGENYEIVLRLAGEGSQQAVIYERKGAKREQAAALRLEAETADGKAFSSLHATKPSRINLYRRGPYYVEVHWLDVACMDAAGAGQRFAAAGEVVFHCYPEKVHVQAIWHAVGASGAGTASLVLAPDGGPGGAAERLGHTAQADAGGVMRSAAGFEALKEGDKVRAGMALQFPTETGHPVSLEEPLPPDALRVLDGLGAEYDPVRGCYMVKSRNPGGFSYHYYENPNHYETARFRLRNGDQPRKVYICHETTEGARGSVECGVLLDEDDDPLPITVQISKNFAGEKEEKFYNPEDTPFSETIFPLHLAPGEAREVASLHLYQNWGNHPLKQFSSLGAWMDYFHSSTGVTETTCYVPFKFGGLPGVAIADLRAMSQRMWASQPQHDNVAGHRFLMYQVDGAWRYAAYRGTTFRSTGPNWMDISMDYLSDDGRIRARLDSFELPQTDELRNFIRLRCEVLAPVEIGNLATDFRLLDITTRIQRLRYTHVAWQSGEGEVETRPVEAKDAVIVPGAALGGTFPWATAYGDKRGCNAFVVRRFAAKLGGEQRGPAVVAHSVKSGDIHLALSAAGGAAKLEPGDFVDAEFYIMPYGGAQPSGDLQMDHATPEADRVPFGADAPRVTKVIRGEKLGDFPCRVRADDGRAEFEIAGGKNAIPIIVEGLPGHKQPRLEVQAAEGTWARVPHETVGNDGYQVFVDDRGTFGCVFLVQAGGAPQTYRVATGGSPKVQVTPLLRPEFAPLQNLVQVQAPWMDSPVGLRFPETIHTDFGLLQVDHFREGSLFKSAKTDVATLSGWHQGPGGSQWFDWDLAESCKAGGIVSPGVDDVRLEFWFYNGQDKPTSVAMQYCLTLGLGKLQDRTGERSYVLSGGEWARMSDADRGKGRRELCHYPVVGGDDLSGRKPDPGGWGASSITADAGLLGVVHEDGEHVLGLAWEHSRTILSNWLIPCIHADPIWPQCGPKGHVRVTGKLYLIEGGLDDLLARYRQDF